jgi:hypothetical protein
MMTYHARIREIQRNLVMGQADRETCFSKFEQILHEYGLLPVEEELDRTITNENFLNLLNMALAHNDVRSNRDPEKSNDIPTQGALLDSPLMNVDDGYRLTDSILHRCPVCHKQIPQGTGLYNRVQLREKEPPVPIDPPRCHACMMKWAEDYVMKSGIRSSIQRDVSFSLDTSAVSDFDKSETDFFAKYEEQMRDFKP